MKKIIEVIPNISEGRDHKVIEALANEIKSVKDCLLMNYSSDVDHNRSVFTYMGSPKAIKEASLKLINKANELIDMTQHKGEHPRMGAVDVMPLVPIKNVSMDECISLSKEIGQEVSEKLNIPVYLYEESANQEYKRPLEKVREGQFEGLEEKIIDPKWLPDFMGKGERNTTFGALIIGARKPLLAYNVYLDTPDVEIAKEISKAIRQSNGGMKNVKALGIYIEEKKLAQVSMNLTDYKVTGLFEVVEKIKEEAKLRGVQVKSSELIGMLPMKAIIEAGAKYLNIENFQYDSQIIENFLL